MGLWKVRPPWMQTTDLKKWPANVGFDVTGNLRLFDFGCAKGSGANNNKFKIRIR